jgi:hypothetical protein
MPGGPYRRIAGRAGYRSELHVVLVVDLAGRSGVSGSAKEGARIKC